MACRAVIRCWSSCVLSQRNAGTTCAGHSAMVCPPALFGMYTTCTAVGAFASFCSASAAS